MSLENNDSDNVKSSESVTGPELTVACCVTVGVWGENFGGFGVGPVAGNPQAFGAGVCGTPQAGFCVGPVDGVPQAFGAAGFAVDPLGGGPHAFGAPGFAVVPVGKIPQAFGGGVWGSPKNGFGVGPVGKAPQAFLIVVGSCWTGLGVGWDGSAGKSSLTAFFGASVEVVGCWYDGLGGGVGESERGGTLGVETTFGTTDFGVDGCTGTDFTVEGVKGTDFCVVVVVVVELVATTFLAVDVSGAMVVVSLSFDLKSPVNPLKNPFFFFVVSSGASVVVVVFAIGGKRLNSASPYDNELGSGCFRLSCCKPKI